MSINIIMMCKNESDLIIPWAFYHGSICGWKNLTIIDNGSDDERTIKALKIIEGKGSNIVRDFNKIIDFRYKGEIVRDIIKNLEINNPSDFYFPLDCDEFIGTHIGERVSFDLNDINAALTPYIGDPRVLMIDCAYDNHPLLHGYFMPSYGQRKCFFAHGACEVLDQGFHAAESKAGSESKKTKIIYMHYHFKPYEIVVAHALEKLRPFVENLDASDLSSIPENVAGFHLLGHLRHASSEDYYSQFGHENYVRVPQFGRALSTVGESLPFDKTSGDCEGFNPEEYLRINADVAASGENPLAHYLRYGRFEGHRWF